MTDLGATGGEEAIIQGFLAPLAQGAPGAFGLTDDCAALGVAPGYELVVTTDSLIEGAHFLPGDVPAFKALAVNVSDLAAKAAAPFAYLLTLALPEAPTRAWLEAFSGELRRAQEAFGCHLVGGDTDRTPGRLTITITALGTVPAGRMLRRATARPGDLVYVTGTIGDAALGLALARDPAKAEAWRLSLEQQAFLEQRFRAPVPTLALAEALRAHASAGIDISDGLVKDFDRLCRASGCGGRLEAPRVPVSAAAGAVLARGGAALADLITGGEDYEILLTLPPEQAGGMESAAAKARVSLTRIGEITAEGHGAAVLDDAGRIMPLARMGWDHF